MAFGKMTKTSEANGYVKTAIINVTCRKKNSHAYIEFLGLREYVAFKESRHCLFLLQENIITTL